MTTFTSPHNLPVIEPNSDKVKDGAEASALAGDINALSMAVNGALSQLSVDTLKQVFLGTGNAQFGDIKDLSTMPNGFVTIGDYLAADGLGLPESSSGVVWSIAHSATNAQQLFFTSTAEGHDGSAHLYSRVKTTSGWGSWRRIDSERPPRTIRDGDLNTYFGSKYTGPWAVASPAAAAAIQNMPANEAGQFMPTSFLFLWPYGIQIAFIYNPDNPPTVKWRGRTNYDANILNAWSDWAPFGGGGGSNADSNVYQNHMAHRDAFIRARGGSIGTGGKAAVALRFDHNMVDFRDIVLPMLRARNLPWCQAVNTSESQINSTTNGGIPLSTIQGWAINDGGEVFPHSHTHADSTSDAAIWANVTDQLPIFAAQMPNLSTEVFAPPGASGTNWNGFLDTTSPAHFTSKYAGARAVLSTYAACAGYIPGALRPLQGDITNGQTHVSLNVAAASSVTNLLNQAQEMGAGVQLFLHPNDLTRPEAPLTPAILAQILDWIVTERDAGRLVVLSPSGLLLADSRHVYRYNILRGFNTAVWPAATGWTFNGNTATGTGTAGLLTGNVSLANLGHIKGRVRELVFEGRGTSTNGVLRMGVADGLALTATKDLAFQGDSTWRTYRIPFTIPVSATSLTVTLGRVSGGALEMRNPAIQAV